MHHLFVSLYQTPVFIAQEGVLFEFPIIYSKDTPKGQEKEKIKEKKTQTSFLGRIRTFLVSEIF